MSRRNSRHDRFAREYIKDLNGTRAAIAAGYAKKTAKSAASRLLSNVNVKKLLKQLADKQAVSLDLSAEKVLTELGKTAFIKVKPSKVTPKDKIRALELLGRYLKLFVEKIEISGLDKLAESIAEARKRAG